LRRRLLCAAEQEVEVLGEATHLKIEVR
jgi:hypothetical protein